MKGDPLETFKKFKIFFEKIFENKNEKWEFWKSHSAEKLERGDSFGFLKLQFAAKYQKTWMGALWRQKKNRKKSHSAEKNSKGGPCSPVRFCILR